MESSYTYRLQATGTGARSGVISSDAVFNSIPFSAPPEFLGDAGMWTPEHFFVAAVAACFVSTFSGMAELSKLKVIRLEVAAEGTLRRGTGGWEFTEVRLHPALTITSEQDRGRAIQLMEKAEKTCLVMRSITARVAMDATVELQQQRVTS